MAINKGQKVKKNLEFIDPKSPEIAVLFAYLKAPFLVKKQ